ncbi:hypothetical protein ACFXKW_20830 [Streptomyces sp. NPDC059193]|uniref:hypothetical protein n=1 Tax=Streptomyces sp. NPDC059193 TaxID=3346763 RepID=UPI0036914D7B
MHRASRAITPEFTGALELFDLVVSGPLRAVHANADGSWTVVPVTGPALLLTGPDQVAAFVDRATHGTGPQALAPATRELPAPATADDTSGCGCAPAPYHRPHPQESDLMHARAIGARMDEYGIHTARRSVAYDDTAQAAALRIVTDHGLYALHIPPTGQQFRVHRNGTRDGVIGARRVPATPDSTVAALLAAYLRDRGAL